MNQGIEGIAIYHRKTKKVIENIQHPSSYVLVDHQDLDPVAVEGLIEKKVRAVINLSASFSGVYLHNQVQRLQEHGIEVFDLSNRTEYLDQQVNRPITIKVTNHQLFVKRMDEWEYGGDLQPYTNELITIRQKKADQNYPQIFSAFVENSLRFASNEIPFLLENKNYPDYFKEMRHKDVFIVARNKTYLEDLQTIKSKMRTASYYIIAVDGAADGLLKVGIQPHMIIGDMDSVSDHSLTCGAKLICHQFLDGRSPGAERLKNIPNLVWDELAFIGTSEDLAIYSAHQSGANHLYLVGCRLGMREFLEKGRKGMGSSIICRIQAGDKITDLKGIHRLYPRKNRFSEQIHIRLDIFLTQLEKVLVTIRLKIWSEQSWFSFKRKKESL
ncbi:putative cytokinetic ring protein SteA [Alkalihalobacillus pseudalcaliphilus]|uniref:putative cytokinetic ring protein SteA n=1 Tax=Alkalihalobacillus pseudalcaliphilus TaxID=79884 RepID=UPI00069F0FA0|nr:putative cytokinetic ring protein SteA [Alkalihalobacillus pseudalcaliphilus]